MSAINLLDKQIVLSLNKSWCPLGHLSVRKSLVAIFSEANDEHAAMPLDIEMGVDENGNDILIYANPVTIDEWLKLPIRDCDLVVHSAHQPVRVPTVIVSAQFNKIPMRRPKLGRSAIYARDGGVCQYTGQYVGRGGNLDHVTPRDRGGKDSFENLVWCSRDINSRKGNRLNSEAGLSLIKKPVAPPALPVSAFVTEPRHPTQAPFLLR